MPMAYVYRLQAPRLPLGKKREFERGGHTHLEPRWHCRPFQQVDKRGPFPSRDKLILGTDAH